MVNIAPLDYERYLALAGPFPLTEAVAEAMSPDRHAEELTQISERMDLWHEFSSEGELERIRLAQQGGRRAAREPAPLPPVHTGPEAELAWSTVIETSGVMSGGETLNAPPLSVAATLYQPVIEPPPHAVSETV